MQTKTTWWASQRSTPATPGHTIAQPIAPRWATVTWIAPVWHGKEVPSLQLQPPKLHNSRGGPNQGFLEVLSIHSLESHNLKADPTTPSAHNLELPHGAHWITKTLNKKLTTTAKPRLSLGLCPAHGRPKLLEVCASDLQKYLVALSR